MSRGACFLVKIDFAFAGGWRRHGEQGGAAWKAKRCCQHRLWPGCVPCCAGTSCVDVLREAGAPTHNKVWQELRAFGFELQTLAALSAVHSFVLADDISFGWWTRLAWSDSDFWHLKMQAQSQKRQRRLPFRNNGVYLVESQVDWLVFLVPCHRAASNTFEGEDGLSEPSAKILRGYNSLMLLFTLACHLQGFSQRRLQWHGRSKIIVVMHSIWSNDCFVVDRLCNMPAATGNQARTIWLRQCNRLSQCPALRVDRMETWCPIRLFVSTKAGNEMLWETSGLLVVLGALQETCPALRKAPPPKKYVERLGASSQHVGHVGAKTF